MAAKVATAIRREQATERIKIACGVLGERFGVKADDLFPRHKQPDIERAIQLEAIADFLSDLSIAQTPKPAPRTRKRKTP